VSTSAQAFDLTELDTELELNRKLLETLTWLSGMNERGQISKRDYYFALIVLDKTTRGLADDDLTAALDEEVLNSGVRKL